MKLLVATIAAVTAVTIGCAGQGVSTSPVASSSPIGASTGRTPGPGDATWSFTIEEIGVGSIGYVTLKNFSDLASSPDALFLCDADRCVDLPDVNVAPGDVIRIATGDGAGLENVVKTGAPLDLPSADGEIALYVSKDVRDPTAMRYYVQWGSTPHALTDVAVAAHLSGTTTYAPSGPSATRLWRKPEGVWVWDAGG